MGVVYYKQNKNILEPHLSWDEMRLVYVSFNDRQETLTPTAVHCHEKNLELQYICGGRGNLRIGSRLYEVQEGDLLVYNQGELHDESADPEAGLWFYNCGVTGLNLPGRPEGELIAPETSPRIHAGETAGVVESLFKLLYAEVERDLPKNEQITHDILRVLISMILYQLPKERQLPPREKDRLLIACKDYIDGHFMEELTVEKLAERSHMSISGFAHQFKKIFGFPPIQSISSAGASARHSACFSRRTSPSRRSAYAWGMTTSVTSTISSSALQECRRRTTANRRSERISSRSSTSCYCIIQSEPVASGLPAFAETCKSSDLHVFFVGKASRNEKVIF